MGAQASVKGSCMIQAAMKGNEADDLCPTSALPWATDRDKPLQQLLLLLLRPLPVHPPLFPSLQPFLSSPIR